MVELTLTILKPHLIKNPYALICVREAISSNGFLLIKQKRLHLSVDEAKAFYAEHEGKFFFNRLITSICSGPIEAYVLAGDGAIQKWRNVMGPTKVFKAVYSDPESLRALYGLSDTRNATHGSDSPESAEREIKLLFPEFSIEDWISTAKKSLTPRTEE